MVPIFQDVRTFTAILQRCPASEPSGDWYYTANDCSFPASSASAPCISLADGDAATLYEQGNGPRPAESPPSGDSLLRVPAISHSASSSINRTILCNREAVINRVSAHRLSRSDVLRHHARGGMRAIHQFFEDSDPSHVSFEPSDRLSENF